MNFQEFLEQYQKVPVLEYPNRVPDNPVVSVCVQAYQHALFIEECLNSILMQKTDFPFEILLGEDDSTDGTREICIEYAEKFPDKIRLFLHRRENNIEILGTPTGRFNFLYNLFSAKSNYIAICEGDDYWTDEYKIQKQYDFLEDNPDFALCGHDAFIIKDGVIIKNSKLGPDNRNDFYKHQNHKKLYVLTLSAFYRKKDTYPTEAMNVLNFDTFLFTYLLESGHYKYLDNIKPGAYRLHTGGMWSSKHSQYKEISDINTQFWLSKYFHNIDNINKSDYYGRNVVRKSISYLLTPTWYNYFTIIKYMISLKFPRAYYYLHSIKNFLKFRRSPNAK